MKVPIEQCREGAVKDLPKDNEGDVVELLVVCQRERGHKGKHAAVWVNGWITWKD